MFRKENRPEIDTANILEHVFSFFILIITKINNNYKGKLMNIYYSHVYPVLWIYYIFLQPVVLVIL